MNNPYNRDVCFSCNGDGYIFNIPALMIKTKCIRCNGKGLLNSRITEFIIDIVICYIFFVIYFVTIFTVVLF